tara:strand:+ start:3156 stop:8807 length:5652 start_codon:yes stop_codon:yes gene_type:complete
MSNSIVIPINPDFLLLETYSVSDENLIATEEISSTFNPETDYVEYYIYGLNNSLLFPPLEDGTVPYTGYSILDNDVYITPSEDLMTYGYVQGGYNSIYNFFSNRLSSSISSNYFIAEVSSDRTEIRLNSNTIPLEEIVSSSISFINERKQDKYYPDFYLNFGSNRTVIANNIELDNDTVLIKLYDPLPNQFQVNTPLWVVEEVAEPKAYNVTFQEEILEEEDFSIPLKGPNINLELKDQINNSTQPLSLSQLNSSPLTSSYQQLQSLFHKEGIPINVDYSKYSNFINFSSIESRIENFEYKLQLIESYTESLTSGSNVSSTTAVSGSKVYYETLINDTITNFDEYEYFLYFESGSKSWPKSNLEPPYLNLSTTDANAISWYNEQISSASVYDEQNQDNLFYDIPEYLRNDSSNQGYIDFVEMIGQSFDNVWIYLKDISNKYNADNRINAGVSKDLVAQILRDFSLKIYQNNFSSNDIYTSFLGLTPSGSLFPFPEITGSLPTPSGFEYVNTFISSSTDAVPLDDVNKRIYKRLYHNLPYLLKSKGTIQGLKTILNIYGIPDTILRISEFGGKDKDNSNDYDYYYRKFNYAFETEGEGYISSSWLSSPEFGNVYPSTLGFRFKTHGIPTEAIDYKQVLWTLEQDQSLDGFYGDPAYSSSFYGSGSTASGSLPAITIRYEGTANTSASFSGSISDPYKQFAHVDFYPDISRPTITASVELPVLDGGWWSLMVTRSVSNNDENYMLHVANNIYNGATGTQIGFQASSSVYITSSNWESDVPSYFGNKEMVLDIDSTDYYKFSGSYQEIRYYNTIISESAFEDYTMNPLSIEANQVVSSSLDNAPNSLYFRASLGGDLYTASISIHPKVTGSWTPSQSFFEGNNFYISDSGSFVNNREYYFFDQPAVGIKNRINDKIKSQDLSLPSYNEVQSVAIPDKDTLSNLRSIQQDKTKDLQYTNNIDLLEVTFSPQNEINDDIISQLGHFNIGNLIGDPREKLTSNQSYPELNSLKEEYFLKYVHENYDFNDYVRLIKFFDNSLFKIIKDFIPVRASLTSGITIKPHLLERQKYPQPQVYWEFEQYSGSVKSFPKGYETGALLIPSGGSGGSFGVFDHLTNFTQSWDGINSTPLGLVPFTQSDAPEFFTGEFSGSSILVTNGELNPECDPYKKVDTTALTYDVVSLTYNSGGTTGTYSQRSFDFFLNPPAPQYGTTGDVVLWWDAKFLGASKTPGNFDWQYQIAAVKIFKESQNGVDNSLLLGDVNNIRIATTLLSVLSDDSTSTTTANLDIDVISVAEYPEFYLYYIKPAGNITLTSPSGTPGAIDVATQSSIATIPTPYITQAFNVSDCNVTYGNASEIRPGTLYQDIDYATSTTTPVNFDQLISGSATKATVPDSNYSTTRIIRPRYNGSRSTSNGFNLTSSIGGLGQLANVEQDRFYFAYFNYIGGTSPEWGNELVDRTGLSLRYYIDAEGSVIEPTNDSKGVNLSIVRQTFTEGETGVFSFDDETGATINSQNLEGNQTIFKSGKRIVPIIYSQTSSISKLNPEGGATGSIEFIVGNSDTLQEVPSIGSYQMLAISPDKDYSTLGPISFEDISNQNDDVNFTNDTTITFDPIGTPVGRSPGELDVTITFSAQIGLQSSILPRVGVFQWFKNGNAVGDIMYLDVGALSNYKRKDTLTYVDNDIQLNDSFELKLTGKFNNDVKIKGLETILSISQDIAPSSGIVTRFFGKAASAGTPTKNIFLRSKDETPALPAGQSGLNDIYTARQVDISGSGFFPIQNQFTLQAGDEIRFKGTEAYTYKIISVEPNVLNNNKIGITLDRNLPIDWTNSDLDHFLVRRYVDAPGSIIVKSNKTVGGTSPGFFMPEYATKGIEDNFDTIIQKLKTDQLI